MHVPLFIYDTASYVRVINKECQVGKSRQMLLKNPTIPRFEPITATLTVQQDALCHKALNIVIRHSVFWTTSIIVLQYIRNVSRRFHIFVTKQSIRS
jgi:hypothetical protein